MILVRVFFCSERLRQRSIRGDCADMTVSSHFSVNYAEAREKFLAACKRRGLSVESHLNPNAKGRQGEDLFMDVCRIGRQDASNVLFLLSATHGVEGYCGSGVQVALLDQGHFSELPDDVSVVMVHALNPFGFSHDRRVNENNIDLNRNFLDFNDPYRPDSGYSNIHAYIVPDDWDGPARKQANKQLALFIEQHGMRAFQAAVSGGQYAHKDGIFYGGESPSWSNQTFRSVLTDYAGNAKRVGVIDFHTGLGPYGYGELIVIGSPEEKARAVRWYGDQVTDPDAGDSSSAPVVGTTGHGVCETLSQAEVAFIALEYGTRDLTTVLTALRADNWLYERGEVDSPLGAEIKAQIRDACYPDADDWKEAVWTRATEIIDLAVEGLTAGK